MKIFTRFLLAVLGFLQIMALVIAGEKQAHAYVDPGSGLLALQVAGSTVAGVVFLVRYRVRKALGLLTKKIDPSGAESAIHPTEIRS